MEYNRLMNQNFSLNQIKQNLIWAEAKFDFETLIFNNNTELYFKFADSNPGLILQFESINESKRTKHFKLKSFSPEMSS